MKKMLSITLFAMVALVTLPLVAAPTGTLYTLDNKSVTGKITWKNNKKMYVVTNAKGGEVEYPADQVDRVDVERPKELNDAIKNVRAGKAAMAVEPLKKLAKEYSHLTWDRVAVQWLVEAYLAMGKASDAVSACKEIIRRDESAAYTGEMAAAYWKALIKAGNTSELDKLLEKAIASGDQAAAMSALVARGNSIMEKGSGRSNCEEALRDGYLRVILLYADPNSDAYAEALYKGAKAFDGMGQGSRANSLREKLKSECRGSTWATKK